MNKKADLILDSKSTLGEGAFWDSKKNVLYWVDIEGRFLHVYNPSTGVNTTRLIKGRPGTVVPRKSSGVVVAVERSVVVFDEIQERKTGQSKLMPGKPVDTEPAELCYFSSEPHGNRLNDGKCDPAGRLWVGTMSGDRSPTATLYRVEPGGSFKAMVTGVTVSNGIVWSADGRTMYYIDTPTVSVQAFDYHMEDGSISGRRTAFGFPHELGRPDGMTIDSEGMLWVAFFRGSAVRRFNPDDGSLLAVIELPVSNVTSCAIGGSDLRDMFITTAREGLTEVGAAAQPLAGGLFHARVDVCGVQQHLFAG